jgi:uncharacterized protein YggE
MTARHRNGSKTTGLTAMAVAAGLLAGQAPVGSTGLSAQEHSEPGHDEPVAGVLHVTGAGSVEVQPDRARLSFAVETEAEDARGAAARNAELMEAVLAALRGAAGPGLTLETSGYNVIPVYEQRRPDGPRTPRIVGYRVVNQVSAVTDELDGVGDLLDAGLGAGSNRISGLSFFVSDSSDARDEAYARAVADALRQARAMAAALGVELGPVEEVRGNSSPGQPRPMGDVMMAAEAAARTPVEAGSTTVTASVTIRFRLGG